MTRTRLARPSIHVIYLENRGFTTAKEVANQRRRNKRFNQFLLPQSRNIDVKICGNVVRPMKVKRRAIFPAMCRNRQY